jgi:transcriptional regulator with XRE-family HTH domain
MDQTVPKPKVRPFSRIGRQAITLLGQRIKLARKQRRMTAQELADRAGISRGLVQRIEKGDPGCQIGAVFETAAILGVPLFDADTAALKARIKRTHEEIALLPAHTHVR